MSVPHQSDGIPGTAEPSPMLRLLDRPLSEAALAAGARKDQIDTVTIDGQPVYRDRYYGQSNMMVQSANVAIPEGGAADAALVVGDLEVTCQVNVVCHF